MADDLKKSCMGGRESHPQYGLQDMPFLWLKVAEPRRVATRRDAFYSVASTESPPTGHENSAASDLSQDATGAADDSR